MKTKLFSKIGGAIAAAIVFSFTVPALHAGPAVTHVYAPIKTMAAADALKPGQKIAYTCPDCGSVTLMTVDKDRNNLKSFTCPMCHEKFDLKETGSSGKTHAEGAFVMVCKKTGEKATLTAMQ